MTQYEDKTDMELLELQNQDASIQELMYAFIKETNAKLTKWTETNIIEQQIYQLFFPENQVV